MVENNDKKFNDQKDSLQKTKEYLEGRIAQTLAFEDKINILNDELRKSKHVADEFRSTMVNKFAEVQSETSELRMNLGMHMTDYQSTFTNQ